MILFMNINFVSGAVQCQLFPQATNRRSDLDNVAEAFHGGPGLHGSSFITHINHSEDCFVAHFDEDCDIWITERNGDWQPLVKKIVAETIEEWFPEPDAFSKVWHGFVVQILDIIDSNNTDKVQLSQHYDEKTQVAPVSSVKAYQPDQIKPELLKEKIRNW